LGCVSITVKIKDMRNEVDVVVQETLPVIEIPIDRLSAEILNAIIEGIYTS
jgi:hypothetical protein